LAGTILATTAAGLSGTLLTTAAGLSGTVLTTGTTFGSAGRTTRATRCATTLRSSASGGAA
jgi:hypothetical protein